MIARDFQDHYQDAEIQHPQQDRDFENRVCTLEMSQDEDSSPKNYKPTEQSEFIHVSCTHSS